MPVRIYDIAKKLGLPNKVVLEKARELGITAARAASCSLDKITAEFLEQQFPKPELAEPKTKKKKSSTPSPATETAPEVEVETEDKVEEEPAQSIVSDAISPAPEVSTPENITSKTSTGGEVLEQSNVSELVIKEVEDFVLQDLEELSAEKETARAASTKPSKPGKRETAEKQTAAPSKGTESLPSVAEKIKEVVSPASESLETGKTSGLKTPPPTPSEDHKKTEPAAIVPVQAPIPAPVKKESQPVVGQKDKKEKSSPAAAEPTKPAPVFELKPIWKIPLSAIGKRLADQKASAEAPEDTKQVSKEVEKPAPEAKLGQKVGFIQLPQKPTPSSKQADKQNLPRGKEKREKSGKEKTPAARSPMTSAPGQQRQETQSRPPQFQTHRQGAAPFSRQQQPDRAGRQDPAARGRQKPFSTSRDKDRPSAKSQQFSSSAPKEGQQRVPENAQVITMKPPVVVRQLAELLNRKPFQLIADLMEQGVFANVNQSIDEVAARKLCAKHGFHFELEKRDKGGALVKGDQKKIEFVEEDDDPSTLLPRPPVVTIMGHVDHGKTTLLDAIRKSNVATGEAGGITQHIGAYTISIPHPERKDVLQQITFLDTPGHEAFSAMRARGANVTDIVILVVAANDGVMPQTVEALRHAQAAKVTIMVAVNKCDHPASNPLKVRQQLQDYGLLCEEWGGSTIYVDVSALTKQGIDNLLGLLVLQAEVLELKANPHRKAKGNVVESGLAPGGPTATVLVRKGTLKLGDAILCGEFYGKARALINEEGDRLKHAGPSEAVKLLGLNGVPEAGTEFQVVENEKMARDMALAQQERNRLEGNRERERTVTLEGFFQNFDADSIKSLKIVVKADTQGSVEAIVDALKKINSEKVSLDIIHSAVGTVTESDVILASASKAVVLGFHSRVDSSAKEAAPREGVQIKLYSIIYELIDQVRDSMAGLLDPIINEVPQGHAEVCQVFNLSKAGSVAGCKVVQGRIIKGRCRVVRGKEVIFEGSFQSLRRFQNEVSELKAGMECGIRIEGFHDYKEGDIIKSYSIEKIAQQL
jgi:translation initiation factor IF-2